MQQFQGVVERGTGGLELPPQQGQSPLLQRGADVGGGDVGVYGADVFEGEAPGEADKG